MDVFDVSKRSEVMSKIRGKNTKPELLLFKMVKPLWAYGFRYRKHYRKAYGNPDLAFPKQRLAIFIDSEFWHGKDYHLLRARLPNEFWRNKISKNFERDIKVTHELEGQGWRVLRIWAGEIKRNPSSVEDMILECLRSS